MVQKVSKGDSIVQKFTADAFNSFADAANEFSRRQNLSTQKPVRDFGIGQRVRIKNISSTTDIPPFGILAIKEPLFDYNDNEDEFLHNVTLEGDVPDYSDPDFKRWVVAQEYILQGEIGWAMIAGITPVKINVIEESDLFCEMKDDDATQLVSGGGIGKILWKETGTGTVWGLIQFPWIETGLAKLQEDIAKDETGGVKRCYWDRSGEVYTEYGSEFTALNIGPGNASSGDVVMLAGGEYGLPFFRYSLAGWRYAIRVKTVWSDYVWTELMPGEWYMEESGQLDYYYYIYKVTGTSPSEVYTLAYTYHENMGTDAWYGRGGDYYFINVVKDGNSDDVDIYDGLIPASGELIDTYSSTTGNVSAPDGEYQSSMSGNIYPGITAGAASGEKTGSYSDQYWD